VPFFFFNTFGRCQQGEHPNSSARFLLPTITFTVSTLSFVKDK